MNSIKDLNLLNKRVLVRADLDVTMTDGQISDDFRLKAIEPTLSYLVNSPALQIIITGHLGRPEGKDSQFSLKPIGEFMTKMLHTQIDFAPEIDKEFIYRQSKVVLVENLKFWPEEKNGSESFGQRLAELADVYVNESFATSHHHYASITEVPKFIPGYAGFRMFDEVRTLQNFWTNSKHPIVFLLGGAKTDKLDSIKSMASKSDTTLVGGVFMKESSLLKIAGTVFPEDDVTGYDIGPKAIEQFKQKLLTAETVLWNGPVGKFEEPDYENGTRELCSFLVEQISKRNLTVVCGGGNTISALKQYGVLDKMSFVSTGGGAMIELLSSGTLPGIEALN